MDGFQRVPAQRHSGGDGAPHHRPVGALLLPLRAEGREIRHGPAARRLGEPAAAQRPGGLPRKPHVHARDSPAPGHPAHVRAVQRRREAVALAPPVPREGRGAHGPHTRWAQEPARGPDADEVFSRKHWSSIGTKLAEKTGVPVVPVALLTDCEPTREGGGPFKDFGPVDPSRPIRFRCGPVLTGSSRDMQRASFDWIAEQLSGWGMPVEG